MKIEKYLFRSVITVVFLMLFATVKTYASDYTITFTGTGASTTVESVIVQNLTQGTSVTVPVGNVLTLSVTPNAIYQLNANNEGISIYPNPMYGKTTVSFYAKHAGNTLFNVFGIDGKQLIGIATNLQEGENSVSLSLPKGIYAIQVAGNGYSYASKVISQTNLESKLEAIFIGADKKEVPLAKKSKSIATTILYSEGDRLLYKGISGNYSTIVVDVPTTSKNTNFDFVACKDADLNNYAVVTIGTQTWMVENLKTTKYRTGDSIANVTVNTTWTTLSTGAWCNYENASANGAKYGKLYNWYAVSDSRNIAPAGWHVVTDAEWATLKSYVSTQLGETGLISKSLAAATNWDAYISAGTVGRDLIKNNSSGLTALPGGVRGFSGSFIGVGRYCGLWSSTESNTTNALYMALIYNAGNVDGKDYKQYGLSVRCVKD